jgi:hypothetical protein
MAAGDLAKTEVFVNLFAGSERSRVFLRVDESGPWMAMTQVMGRYDPVYLALHQREAGPPPSPGRRLPNPTPCQHLWQAMLPTDIKPGAHTLHVRATDTFGRTHFDRRVIQITV